MRGRKFHELNYVNFQLSKPANQIDKKFTGLMWITPEYKDNPNYEIDYLKEVKSKLLNDDRKKMLISNYSFFSIILNEKLFSPSRWYLSDGTDFPQKGNKYYNSYKSLLINLIKNNDIAVIYTVFLEKIGIICMNYINKNLFFRSRNI